MLTFESRTYEGRSTFIDPPPGRQLGPAVAPACNDTGRNNETARTALVEAVPGVDPRSVVVERRPSGGQVYVAAGASLPAAVKRSIERPTCRTAGGPFRLDGQWLDIETTGLKPPYGLSVKVDKASKHPGDYKGAELTVQVTNETRNPVTRSDVENVLWTGTGRVAVSVRCERGEFVAERLIAKTRP